MNAIEYRLEQVAELHGHFALQYDVIEKALAYADGSHTMDDIWKGIDEGKLQFWYGAESIILTEILQTPQRSILHFFLIGGKKEELQRMYPGIIEWGKAQGCVRASGIGRPGFSRIAFLKDEGWAPVGVVYHKELHDGRERLHRQVNDGH